MNRTELAVEIVDESTTWAIIDCGDYIELYLYDGTDGLRDGLNRMNQLYPGWEMTDRFWQMDDEILRFEIPVLDHGRVTSAG
jgi:hypothetical protein